MDDKTISWILSSVTILDKPCCLSVGDLTVSLYPTESGGSNRGLVVRAVLPGASAYIMGDADTAAELEILSAGVVADADILVAGHHGSAGASGALFLRAVQAETAVVSVGANNAFNLPADAAMERLLTWCGTVYRTDEDGTVVLSLTERDAGHSRRAGLLSG